MRRIIISLLAVAMLHGQQPLPGPNHGAGNVLGGPALTTTGAIPYVSAPGVLSEDLPGICWDAVNKRLGIGTCSPTTRLHIIDSTGATIRLVRTSNRFEIEADNSLMSLVARDAGDIAVVTSGGEKLRVLENGNLLIGTITEGNFKLDVANSGSAGTFRAYDARATIGNTLAVVRAGAGQVGNLQEWQNAFGVVMARVENSGRISTTNTFLIDTTTGVVFSGLAATLGSYSRGVAIGYDNQSDGIVHATAFVFPGTTSTTTTLGIAKNGTDTVEINNGTAGTFRDLRVQKTQTSVVAVASLGTCNAAAEGSRWGVTDALAPVSLAIVAGGGAVRVATYCNGTNWIVQ